MLNKVNDDFTKILDKAKELEAKMKESRRRLKVLRLRVSGSNSVKVKLNGDGEMVRRDTPQLLSEENYN